jgi:hypothetical protein
MNALSHKLCADAQFIVGWIRGTYGIAGIFALPVDTLTDSGVKAGPPPMT